jgi:hypothetical protein
MHSLELVNIVDFRGCDFAIVASNKMQDIFCAVMSLEAVDDSLIQGLNVCCQICLKILNMSVLKAIRDDVA